MIRNNWGKEYLRFKILSSLNIHSYESGGGEQTRAVILSIRYTQLEKLLLASELQLVICISGKSSIGTAISLFHYNWNNSLFLIHHIHNYTSCTTAAAEKLHITFYNTKNSWFVTIVNGDAKTIAIFSGNISICKYTTKCPHKKKLHRTGKTKLKP